MTSQLSLFSNNTKFKLNLLDESQIKQINKSITLKLKVKSSPKKIKRYLHCSSIETATKSSIDTPIRKDFFGVEICKRNKRKYKVTFADEVYNNDDKLIEEIPVESYKKYNYCIYKKNIDNNQKDFIGCSGCLII
jgi:hypothetical protein